MWLDIGDNVIRYDAEEMIEQLKCIFITLTIIWGIVNGTLCV